MQNKTNIHQIQKVIILGLLHSQKISGYDIKKFLNHELSIIAHPENKSVYYPLKKMISEKLIKMSVVEGDTKLKKYIYSITVKGKKTFQELCNLILLSEKRPFFDMDIPLYFLPFLDTKKTMARLKIRRKFFVKARRWLENKEKEEKKEYKQFLINHQLKLLEAEENFLIEIMEKIKSRAIL